MAKENVSVIEKGNFTASERQVLTAKWVLHDDGCLAYKCSACGKHAYGCFTEVLTGEYKYCPHCGAKMELE